MKIRHRSVRTLKTLCPDFEEWPQRWSECDRDLPMGKALLDDMAPLIEHLIARGRADRTVKRHCTHLWLLGGEIIRDVNLSGEYQCDPHEHLIMAIDCGEGPLCRHLDTEAEQEAFDATCRALYRFLRESGKALPVKGSDKSKTRPSAAAPVRNGLSSAAPTPSGWTIAESDWKHLRRVQPEALERLCRRILQAVATEASSGPGTAHQRYQKAWKVFQDRDEELGWAFNDLKRSTALSRLAAMRHLGLVTEEEFAGFSDELCRKVNHILAYWKGK